MTEMVTDFLDVSMGGDMEKSRINLKDGPLSLSDSKTVKMHPLFALIYLHSAYIQILNRNIQFEGCG